MILKIKRSRVINASQKSSEVLAFGLNGILLSGLLQDVTIREPRNSRALTTDCVTMAGVNLDDNDVLLQEGLPVSLILKGQVQDAIKPSPRRKDVVPSQVNEPEG